MASTRHGELSTRAARKIAYPFFGIVFEQSPILCVWVEEEWNKPILDDLRQLAGTRLEYSEVERRDRDVLFVMRPDKYLEFMTAAVERQEKLLRDFFGEANLKIEGLIPRELGAVLK